MIHRISIGLAFLTSLGMFFIGARFFIAPEAAEAGYGLHFGNGGDFSFHYIKGIRDLFTGLVICVFVLSRQVKALGVVLLTGTIIPLTDMLIVLGKDYNGIDAAVPHIAAVVVCLFCGMALLVTKRRKPVAGTGYAKIIQPTDGVTESIIEYKIVPGEKTPWHYHDLFSETFEVISGTLEVGRNKKVLQLKQGDAVTISPGEHHYFHNVSGSDCLIRVVIAPGNVHFEQALLIAKGLAKDGLASSAGVPSKLSDLALFIYLNNSRMVGLQKMVEPLFNYLAQRAIRKGRLKELKNRYVILPEHHL